jgi:hypothetical protein
VVLTPGFYQQTHEPRKRGRRERWVIALGGAVVAIVIAVTVFSLSSHDGKNGKGCLNFTYAIVMGGEQFHACGAQARKYCASPPKLGGLANGLTDRLRVACREIGLATPAPATPAG